MSGKDTLRTPLKLPKPLNSSDITNDACLTSTPYKEEVNVIRKEVKKKGDPVSLDDAEKSIDTSEANNDSFGMALQLYI